MYLFFFFNDTATTEIYTLSLHDALPIYFVRVARDEGWYSEALMQQIAAAGHIHFDAVPARWQRVFVTAHDVTPERSEEHTSELQSRPHLVCRLLLEKKKIPRSPRPKPLT